MEWSCLQKRIGELEVSAQAALLDCGYSFSPRLESTAPGTVIIDLTGSARLLGSAKEIAQQLLRHTEACGFVVNIAVAANPDTALHAARGCKGLAVIPPGQEAARLGCLPITVLELPEEILEVLGHWGIADFKSLAALPQVPLTERLGQQGLYFQRLAKGEVERELLPAENPPSFRECMELEEPVDLLEPLGFILNRLLEQLMYRLRERSLATDHVQLDLTLEVHPERQLQAEPLVNTITPHCRRTLKLPVPTQDARVLLKLLQLDLSAHPPEAPVKIIMLEAFPARMRCMQAGLFQPLAPEPAKLEITLARLRAVVGAEDSNGRSRVGFPRTLDSHRPDSFEVLPAGAAPGWEGEAEESCQMALRLFRPALAARVELREGRPAALAFHHTRAQVVRTAGPWQVTGAWWDAGGEWQRDEWDLHLSFDGAVALYRVFQDLCSGQWFVEGMYD